VSGDRVSLCSTSREKRFSGVHCFLLGLQSSTPSPFPCAFLPSFLPSFLFSSLLFPSCAHVDVGPLTFLTSSSFPVTPTPSFARHRVRFRLLFLAVLFFLLSVCLWDRTRFLLFLLFPRCSKCVRVPLPAPPCSFKRN